MLRCFVVLCAVAAAAAQNEPMTDPRTGAMLYFDTAMGYYYDGNCNRYYDTTTDLYLDTYTNAWYMDPEGRCWDITTTGNTMMDPFTGNMLYYDDSKRMYYDITNNRYFDSMMMWYFDYPTMTFYLDNAGMGYDDGTSPVYDANMPMRDDTTGAMMYFDYSMGFYFDPNMGRYFDPTTGLYLDTYYNVWYEDSMANGYNPDASVPDYSNDYINDPRTGATMYFDNSMGYYHDANNMRYYDDTTDLYMDPATGNWYMDEEGRGWDITTSLDTMVDPHTWLTLYHDMQKMMYYDRQNDRYYDPNVNTYYDWRMGSYYNDDAGVGYDSQYGSYSGPAYSCYYDPSYDCSYVSSYGCSYDPYSPDHDWIINEFYMRCDSMGHMNTQTDLQAGYTCFDAILAGVKSSLNMEPLEELLRQSSRMLEEYFNTHDTMGIPYPMKRDAELAKREVKAN